MRIMNDEVTTEGEGRPKSWRSFLGVFCGCFLFLRGASWIEAWCGWHIGYRFDLLASIFWQVGKKMRDEERADVASSLDIRTWPRLRTSMYQWSLSSHPLKICDCINCDVVMMSKLQTILFSLLCMTCFLCILVTVRSAVALGIRHLESVLDTFRVIHDWCDTHATQRSFWRFWRSTIAKWSNTRVAYVTTNEVNQ